MSYSDFITNAFKSERLVYRAAEDNDEDRAWISELIQNDAAGMILSNPRLPVPMPLSATQDFLDYQKKAMFSLLICLPLEDNKAPAHDGESEATKKPKKRPAPIGFISLFSTLGPNNGHHRNAMIGVGVIETQRGKGYGGEAINWALDWAFRRAGLHRVSIGAFSFNEGGLSLYRKLGFKDEGVEREAIFFDRKWHDLVHLGMLENEWEEIRGLKP
ncbi:putative [ribosomal protein S5]-alanine N-acetyltransferase [Paramyrothecium foliicola]|nr:putative [ribosomal protein S5]-alanine N-acetyltransferase [Paramyrothecium foliicola]